MKSELNPADHASRGIRASETSKLERWKRGPEFLWKSSEEWPTQPRDLAEGLDENDEGVKKDKVIVCGASMEEEFWSQLLRRFSSWEKLRRVVAWLIRVFRRPEQSRDSEEQPQSDAKKIRPLTVAELEEAERKIIRRVQEESFPEIWRG